MTAIHPATLVAEIRHEARRQQDAAFEPPFNPDRAHLAQTLDCLTVNTEADNTREHARIVATLPDTPATRQRGQQILVDVVARVCGKYGLVYDEPTSTRLQIPLP